MFFRTDTPFQHPPRALSALGTLLALAAGAAAAASPSAAAEIAFALPDAAINAVPYDAFRIERRIGEKTQVVSSRDAIAACDAVEFDPKNALGVKRVVFATAIHGRNIVLDAARPRAVVGCESGSPQKVAMSDAALRLWRDVVTPNRAGLGVRAAATRGAEVSKAAGTRGEVDCEASRTRVNDLFVPVLSASETRVAAGMRSLYLTWSDGDSPHRVTVTEAATGRVMVDLNEIREQHIQLPRVQWLPGRYVLTLSDACGRAFREDQLNVVPTSSIPVLPVAISSAKLPDDERAMLYVYWLEGFDNGIWALEAMQRAAELAARLPAAAQWLSANGVAP